METLENTCYRHHLKPAILTAPGNSNGFGIQGQPYPICDIEEMYL